MRISDWSSDVCSSDLLEMIGEIGAEIGPAAVRLLDRTVLIVAEPRRAEQRQFDRFPVFGRFALRRFEQAVVDEIMVAQPFFGRGGLAFRLQFGLLGEEREIGRASVRERGCQYV